MTKTRFVIFLLILVFCFSSITAYSEPTDDYEKACKIIEKNWINSDCAIGIAKDITNPVEKLKRLYVDAWGTMYLERYKFNFLIGECYYHGEGVSKSNESAYYYYTHSEGYIYAKYKLAIMALNNETTNISFKDAEKYLKEAAESGYRKAQCELALLVLKEQSSIISSGLAEFYLRHAAESDYNKAKYELAMLVLNNKFSIVTKEKALEYLKEAVNNGYKPAVEYLKGKESEKKQEEEGKILIKEKIPSLITSAEKEENDAILELADNYSKVNKFLSDTDKKRIKNCVEKLIKSAENDKKEAMKALAFLYANGNFDFLPKDKDKAKYWIKKYQHELDSVLDQEMAMLDFYVLSGSGKLADSQAKKKIINNIKRFDINEITPDKLRYLLFVTVDMPLSNLAYTIDSDTIRENFEKNDYTKKYALPILSIDNDFKKFCEPIKRLNKKSVWISEKLSDEDYNYFYSLASGEEKYIWLNAVYKYINIHNSNIAVIKNLKDYFEGLANKIDSEIDLEDIEALIDLIKEKEAIIKNNEKKFEEILFDVPTKFASLCVEKKLSEYFISYDEKRKIADSFSLITSTTFPYTVNNETREKWFNAVKKIKQNFSENEYKELHNLASKLIPSIELPANVKLEWPE